MNCTVNTAIITLLTRKSVFLVNVPEQLSQTRFILYPRQSILLTRWLTGLYALTIVAVSVMSLAMAGKLLLFILLWLNFCYTLSQRVQLPVRYVLCYQEDSGWQLGGDHDGFESIVLTGATLSTSFLVILHFARENGEQDRLLIVKDMMPLEKFSRLRALLKISPLNASIG